MLSAGSGSGHGSIALSAAGGSRRRTGPAVLGILTRHAYPNYGSLLQALALQSALAGLGADCEIIDYVRADERATRLGRTSLAESRVGDSRWGRFVYRCVQDPNLAVMFLHFRRNQRRLLRLSDTVDDVARLGSLTPCYERVVVGSDQVWSPVHGAVDPAYFLQGAPIGIRAHSYAAGVRAGSPAEQAELPGRLARFETVSVRERSALGLVDPAGGHARVDLDPVLLVCAQEWGRFAGRRVSPSPYILVYRLHTNPVFDEALAQVRATLGLPIRQVTADARRGWSADHREYLATPERFVALFRDAAHVVTDSFHGSAFSVLFGRPFTAVAPVYAAQRVSDLLAEFDLPRRTSGEITHVRESADGESPLLVQRRAASLNYLAEIAAGTST